MALSQQNLALPWSKPGRRSLLIVTKMSHLRLRRRQHRLLPQLAEAEAAARCGREVRATAAGWTNSASAGTKEAGMHRGRQSRSPIKVAAPATHLKETQEMFEDAAVAPDAARAWTQRQKRLQTGFVTNLTLRINLDRKNECLSNRPIQ